MFDKGNDQGAFGPRHIVAYGWRIAGAVDSAALRAALLDVVVRHEALRTSIVRDVDQPYQLVHPPQTPELLEYALDDSDQRPRDVLAHLFVNQIESGRCPVDEQPLLRAALGRFDDQDAVLVLYAHHTVSDGWSLQLIVRDLVQFYAARRGFGPPRLPELTQYQDFTAWQREELNKDHIAVARGYWRDKLAGAEFLPVPTDRTKTDDTGVYTAYRFTIDHDITSATQLLAKQLRSSPFMVLQGAFNLWVHKMTGVTDVVVPTISSGRVDPRFYDTVGPLLNFVPLRTDLSECRTFRDVLARTRATCLEAYSYEIPFSEVFAEAPGVFGTFADQDSAVHALEVFQFPVGADGTLVGDIKVSEMRRRLVTDPDTSDIPDGVLWALDIHPEGDMVGSVRFNGNDVDQATAVEWVDDYVALLRGALAAIDTPIGELPEPARAPEPR
ncbi:MAG TPA: condensation domain-containing protein [Pseudonocardiaceae bacterium]|jgi:hypothetical protein|nr:condensation domain-containing protein [Pseudonocardiaceae bacterium]